MVEKNREIILVNRDSGHVGYTIPDSGIHREFSAGEAKRVTFDEIEKLSWVPGGREMLKEYLIIQDKEAVEELLGDVPPEYFYTKETVQKLLLEGTFEQLQDTLEFGPKGVKDLVKQEAVELQVNNVAMRKEIQRQTNFNVDRAIEINEESKNIENDEVDNKAPRRRSQPITTNVTGNKYKNITLK